MNKIILTGYMGSGKTTVGKELAKLLSIPFFDLDQCIEREVNLNINEIFETKGDVWFRKKEHDLLKSFIQQKESFVLALGGGTPCYANNHLLLKSQESHSIYLKATVQTLTNRLSNEKQNRPLLKNLNIDLPTYISQHLLERSFFYLHAHHSVSVDDKTSLDIANEIIDILKTNPLSAS